VLCFALAAAAAGEAQLFVAFNMSAMAVEIALPHSAHGSWRRVADTGLPAPAEIVLPEQAELVVGSSYVLGADSVAVLESG
jgi:pullulanase/glycogen debranching enzyme